jgi:hypothetical protein
LLSSWRDDARLLLQHSPVLLHHTEHAHVETLLMVTKTACAAKGPASAPPLLQLPAGCT